MDGEFLTILQRGFTKSTPCIMLSGKSESENRYKLGAQDYLTAPLTEIR
jgi:DNA-binding response OmpR family regulator